MQRSRADEQAELQISHLKFQKKETSKTSHLSQTQRKMGHPKFQRQIQTQIQKQIQRQNHEQNKSTQDELPVWYYRGCGEINCGHLAAKGRATAESVPRPLSMKSQSEPKEFTRSDLRFAAYAGLFDGEGSIGMLPAKKPLAETRWRYRVVLRVAMINREVLARMSGQFGAGTLNKYGPRPRRQPYWSWVCGAREDVIRILTRLRPHLDLKTHEANLALDYLLPESLTCAQQDRIYRAMKLAKSRRGNTIRNQYGAVNDAVAR